jgi:hypothetical protein
MIGLCVLTIAIALGALGISNSIQGLQNVFLMKEMKKELEEVKKEMKHE